jgi:hypothetical protein
MINRCPGSDRLREMVKITYKPCPECGRELEIMSCLPSTTCVCGFVAYSETASCIRWCAHARECVGDDVYDQYMSSHTPPRHTS